MWKDEVKEYLIQKIIPFWNSLLDEKNGGFYGQVDSNLVIYPYADKGCILNSRILWFYSEAYGLLGDKKLLDAAKHAYKFFRDFCWDDEMKGVYWSVHYNGKPADVTKHTYCQAFAIYGLSAYYEVSKDEEALLFANQLFSLVEHYCKDEYGYLESFDRQFHKNENDKLSENGVIAEKTMNTLLHIFEAYTKLYKVSKNKQVLKQMEWILSIFSTKVYNKTRKRQEVFFDTHMNSILDLHSYGHDIETAWLLDEGCDEIKDGERLDEIRQISSDLTETIYKTAYDGQSLYNECCNGVIDSTKIWWVQAEAIVGFMNGYQREKKNLNYYQAAEHIWNFMKTYLIDRRTPSDCFWEVDAKGAVNWERNIVDSWKCPYHNGRMCMEIIRRTENDT